MNTSHIPPSDSISQEGADANTSHMPSFDSILQGADVNTSHMPSFDSILQEMGTNQTNGENQVNRVLTSGGVITEDEQVETSFNPATDHVKFCSST